jgi:hypothetical protein
LYVGNTYILPLYIALNNIVEWSNQWITAT